MWAYLCVWTCVLYMHVRVSLSVCISSEAWNWFGLALCLVQSDNSDVCPGGLHYCSSSGSMRIYSSMCVFCVCACACVCELVFLLVPAALLAGWECRECLALTPPLVLLAQPTPVGHWWGVMGALEGNGGSDSSVTLTRNCRPLSQSGIAHPQCQRREFIFLAPALPSAGCRGPPSAGSLSVSLRPKPLLLWPERDLLGRVENGRKKNCLWPPLNLK